MAAGSTAVDNLNSKVLGALSTIVPEEHKVDSRINFGPGAHFKGVCDGFFGARNHVLKQAGINTWVDGIVAFHAVLQALHPKIIR